MANDLNLRLRIRVNSDGTAQTLNQTSRGIEVVAQKATQASSEIDKAGGSLGDMSNKSRGASSVLDQLNNRVLSTAESMFKAADAAIYWGSKFNQVISNNLGIAADFANKLGGIKGGMLGILALRDASAVDLFGGFAIRAGALGLQVKEAKDFESAFADVKKVVSGTSDELNQLSRTIKDLASDQIPLPLSDLVDIAKSGGQLGIATDQLENYIQTVSQASVALEILPDEAGMAIGGLVNIFNEPISAIKILLDQINVLGDTTGATERDILEVMRFVSGEGKRFGLLKGEIAALSATMLSLQKPPEIVRTALSGLFSALSTGEMRGDKFNESLTAMGMSADKLAADIQAKPKAALLDFLETLGSFKPLQQSKLLSGLFGLGTDAPAIGELASALDIVKDNMAKVSDEASVSGNVLKTFEARAGTLDNKLQLAGNSFHHFAIEVGNPFLAPVKLATDAFHGFMDSLAQFAADHPAISAFVRIISLVGSLSLFLNSLRAIAPLAATAITGLSAAMAGSAVVLFAARFAAASLAITLLTGVIGGLPSLALSAGVAIAMIGYNSVVAFTAAGTSATVFGAVLTGVRTTMLTLVGAFGGGWIAAALIGISSLVVAWTNYKDEIYQVGDQQASLENIVIASFDVMYTGAVDYTSRVIEAFATLPDSIGSVWRKVAANTRTWLDQMRADNVLYIDSILNAHQRLITFIVDSLPKPTSAAKPSPIDKLSNANTDTSGISSFVDRIVEDFQTGVNLATQDLFVKPVQQQLKIQADQQQHLQDANAKAVQAEIDARNKLYEEQKKNNLKLNNVDMPGTEAVGKHKAAIDTLKKAVDDEMRSLNDQHNKLTLSERDYYAATLAAKGMDFATKSMALAIWDSNKALEAQKAADEKATSAMDTQIDRYNKLTMSARDYFVETLKRDKISPEKAAPIIKQFDKNNAIEADKKQIDDARQSLESYASSLDSASNSMTDFGSIASSSLDGALGGVSAVAGAFANMLAGIDENAAALDALRVKQQALQHFKPANPVTDPDQYAQDIKLQADLQQKFAAEQAELTARSTQLQLAGFGQIAGAAKGMFKEQSTGYKALQAAEQTFRAFEMAQALMSFDAQGGLMQVFTQLFMTGKQAEQAADATATGQAVVQSQIRGQAKASEAVATQASAGPYVGFALMAAMAVAMAALGFSTGASASASLSASRQEKQGSGTVFGDAEAKSESIGNAIETMKDVDLSMLPLTAQMAASLRAIESSLAGLGNLLIQANVANPDIAGLGTTYFSDTASSVLGPAIGVAIGSMFGGPMGAALGQAFGQQIFEFLHTIDPIGSWLVNNIFGKTTASVADSGITIPQQSVGDLLGNGLLAQQYADIKTKTDYVFGLFSDTDMTRKLQALDGQTSDQLTKLMQSIVGSVQTAAQYLTGSSADIQQKLSAYVLNIGDISLKDLSGEKLVEALNNVFSKAADEVATAAFNQLVPFQQVGEGYFETLLRVATGVEQARGGLQALNVQTIDYTDIINQQGDVFTEVVRQSIVAVEQYPGVLNGVGQIIDALSGSGTDLLGTYQQLLAVRQLMTATGLNGGALDATLIGSAGGLNVLTSGLETFKDKFFSEEQRFNASTREMTDAFAALNLALPASRDGFVQLVQGIDDSTAAGRTLLGQVFRLAEGFDNLATQAENLLNKLNDNITNAYDTAADLLNKQITTYAGIAESLTKYSDSLISNAATNSPSTQYSLTRDKFFDLKKVLATGSEAEKLTALGQLQDVAGAFDAASRAFNKSGMGYVKDQASIQGVLASAIGYSTTKADVAQSQLDTLKDQLKSLGLLQEAVTDVKTAVVAVGIAIAGLDAFKQAQQQSQALSANQAAFNQIEQSRKTAYDATLSAMSRAEDRATTGARIQQAAAVRGYVNSSKSDFSVAAAFNPATGANTSAYDGYTGGGKAGDVWSGLTGAGGQFERIRNLVSNTARTLTGIVGGTLPDISLTVAKAGTSYAFAGKQAFYAGDTVDSLLLGFAKDAAAYLADQTGQQDWISEIKAVPFNSLAAGFAELAEVVTRLKHPYQAGEYAPTIDYTTQLNGLKKFATGGIAREPAIFGEAGPEAAVPLPDGRSIPVMLLHRDAPSVTQPARDDGELVDELRAVKKELEALNKKIDEQNRHAAANVATDQAGFKQVAAQLEKQIATLESGARGQRIKESVHG